MEVGIEVRLFGERVWKRMQERCIMNGLNVHEVKDLEKGLWLGINVEQEACKVLTLNCVDM